MSLGCIEKARDGVFGECLVNVHQEDPLGAKTERLVDPVIDGGAFHGGTTFDRKGPVRFHHLQIGPKELVR
jgi:hypothetical protein